MLFNNMDTKSDVNKATVAPVYRVRNCGTNKS